MRGIHIVYPVIMKRVVTTLFIITNTKGFTYDLLQQRGQC